MGCSSRRKAKRQKRTPRASKKAHASSPQLRLLYVASPRLASPRLELRRALRRAFQNTGYLPSFSYYLGSKLFISGGSFPRYACCGNTKPYVMLGGGYLLGLPVGFIADSIGATVGAAAAFLLGRTILFLLRLVPIIPFNMLNYALSVTPIPLGKYILASWLGKMPVTLALVYIGTTLKDLSDVTHGWHDFSKAHWALIIAGLVVSVVVLICVTKVARMLWKKHWLKKKI